MIRTYAERCAQGLYVSLVDPTDAGERCTHNGAGFALDALTNEIWGLALKLLESRQVLSSFVRADASGICFGMAKRRERDVPPCDYDCDVVDHAHLKTLL